MGRMVVIRNSVLRFIRYSVTIWPEVVHPKCGITQKLWLKRWSDGIPVAKHKCGLHGRLVRSGKCLRTFARMANTRGERTNIWPNWWCLVSIAFAQNAACVQSWLLIRLRVFLSTPTTNKNAVFDLLQNKNKLQNHTMCGQICFLVIEFFFAAFDWIYALNCRGVTVAFNRIPNKPNYRRPAQCCMFFLLLNFGIAHLTETPNTCSIRPNTEYRITQSGKLILILSLWVSRVLSFQGSLYIKSLSLEVSTSHFYVCASRLCGHARPWASLPLCFFCNPQCVVLEGVAAKRRSQNSCGGWQECE